MDELAKLTIRVDSKDARDASTNLSGLTKEIGTAEGAAGRLTGAATKVGAAMTGITLAAGAAVAALKPIVDAGDKYTQLANKLSAVSGGGDMVRTQQQLFTLAQQTGQSYESIVSSFARASLSAKALNATQTQMVTLTGTVSKALQVSGASAGEAASASNQLAQALSSGVLAGDELKAILENAPVLAQQIAAGLGVGTGELRKMGAEGKLLSTDVFAAILKQSGDIDAMFAKMNGTVAQSAQRVSDAWDRVLAGLDQKIGASKYLRLFLDATARTLTGESSSLGGSANTAGGGAAFTAGFIPGAEPQRFINPAQAAAATRNPLFRPGFSPINMAPQGGLDGINRVDTFEARKAAGLPVMEFGRGAAADPDGLAKLYDAPRRGAAKVASETQTMLADLAAAGQELVRGIERRFEEMGALMDALANTTVRTSSGQRQIGLGREALRRTPIIGADAPGPVGGMVYRDRGIDPEKTLTETIERTHATTQALADGLQRSIAQGIAGGFTDGSKSLQAFADNLKRTLINVLSESLANNIVGGLMGDGSGGGLLGGLLGKGGAAKGAASTGKGFLASGGALAGFGILAASQILPMFGAGNDRRRVSTFDPGPAYRTPEAPVAPAGTYNAPGGFNAGAYRFEAGRPSGTTVTGNTIVVTLPEGTPREQAEAMLAEFERLQRAQGLPVGTLPQSSRA